MDAARTIVAKSGNAKSLHSKNTGWMCLISIGIMLFFGVCAVNEAITLWSMLPILLAGFAMLWLFWNPKGNALNAIWRKPAEGKDAVVAKLEQMLSLKQESDFAFCYNHQPARFIAFIAAFALLFGGTAVVATVNGVTASRYHAMMTDGVSLLNAQGSGGTHFVLYDKDTEHFFRDSYLPDKYCAQSVEDVAGVLIVDTDKIKVGTYGSKGNAYKYRMTITLYDCVEGEEIAHGSLEGGDPPKQVTTRGIQVFTGKNG